MTRLPTRRRPSWAALLIVAAAAVVWAAPRLTFLADDPIDRDVIVIRSDAPLELMVTRVQNVRGEVSVNPDNVLDHPRARFELAVADLDTGIPLRNEHLLGEEWLAAEQHPTITFSLDEVRSPVHPTALQPHEPLALDVLGSVTIKGVTRQEPVALTVTYLPESEDTRTRLPGDLLRIDGTFDILLSDYGVNIDSRAVRKVANRQQVELTLFTATERMRLDPPR